MPIVLGFHSHNLTGAALLRDKKIISAVSEERLDRVKNSQAFPEKSIKEALREGKLNDNEVDIIALGDLRYNFPIVSEYFKRMPETSPKYYYYLLGRIKHVRNMHLNCSNANYGYIRKHFTNKTVEYVEHHLSHAASAHFTSGNDKNLIVTIDGWGDKLSNGAYMGSREKIERLYSSCDLDSLGYFYSRITIALGFKPHRHEGKITGLAAYGKPTKELMDIMNRMGHFDRKNMRFRFNLGKTYFPTLDVDRNFISMISKFKREDVAAAAQKFLEDTVREYIVALVDKEGSHHFVLAGGTFANVKLNQAVKSVNGVKSIFIHPGMGDEGLCLGSALQAYNDNYGYMNAKLKDVYFGPEYSGQEIKNELDKANVSYIQAKNIELQVAELLAKGKVVARFNGRMEYGPRALGNRTIMYQTQDKSVNDWLNKRLHRCYDEETEILTNEGWKLIKGISDNEVVATLNPKKDTIEFQNIIKKVSYDYNGQMFKIKNRRIDLVITPNHNLWVKKKHGQNYSFMKIDDAAKIKTYHYQRKSCGNWKGKKRDSFRLGKSKIRMEIWLEFLGYYISEGSFYYDGYGRYKISIAQSKKSIYFNPIKKCLEKLSFKFHYSIKEFIIYNKGLFEYLKKLGKAGNKHVPREFMSLSKEQLMILFKALIDGDGNIRGNGYRYATTSKLLADDVQELAFKLGFSAYLSMQKKSINPNHHRLYMVRIGRSSVTTVRASHISKMPYHGKVYCVTAPNHIIYVRRNGKSVFSGNTEFMPFAPVTLSEHANKCYKDIKGAEYTAKFMTITFDCTDWMKENCAGVVHIDGTARPQLIDKETNPGYYRIVDEYRKITGIPCLINTSFNMHEEPIVCSPYDAIRAFLDGGLDYLAIGDFLAKKR
ncbi:hypothetical protein HYS31_02410 [Candidatus Woesearchaeota archaeon]|nr:hypothetical protein [Candidatus Woesearchaeota archaeon]